MVLLLIELATSVRTATLSSALTLQTLMMLLVTGMCFLILRFAEALAKETCDSSLALACVSLLTGISLIVLTGYLVLG